MAISLKIFVAVAGLIAVTSGEFSYKGYKVLRITPTGDTHEDAQHLMRFLAKSKLDVWREPRFPGGSADVMVSPQEAARFKFTLRKQGFNASVMIEDVETLIEKQNGGRTRQTDDQLDSSGFHWVGYHSLARIHAWMEQKAELYSGIASIISAGKTVEGRDILGIRIAHKENLPIVFIEAGVHAREWVSTASATWFIRQVLSTNDEILKSYEWHIFPSINPDGYDFSRTVRFWRKNRQPATSEHPGDTENFCMGVDLNRNWPFEWRPAEDVEHIECYETYPGLSAGSEPETKGLVAYLNSVANRTRVYISIHSYSQLLMYPWAYSSDLTDDNDRLGEVAQKAAKKLQALYGTEYKTGPTATTIYPAPGSTVDYAYSIGIRYSYVFELRDTGDFGFLLPKEQIIPTAQETLEAVTVILDEAKKD